MACEFYAEWVSLLLFESDSVQSHTLEFCLESGRSLLPSVAADWYSIQIKARRKNLITQTKQPS